MNLSRKPERQPPQHSRVMEAAPRAPRRRFATDRGAATGPIGGILLIGIVVVLAALFVVMTQVLRTQPHDPVESGGKATFTGEGYYLEPSGPDDIPVAGSTLFITLDGVQTAVPLSTFSAQIGGPAWTVGTRLCIIGPVAGCYSAAGREAQVTVYSNREYVFQVEALRSQSPAFLIGAGSGGITVSGGTWNVNLAIVGAQITCGASGPQMDVTARYTQNGGSSYASLFGGAPVNPNGGQSLNLGQVPAGSVLGVEGRARLASCSFDKTYTSIASTPHVLTLKQGDAAPNRPAFGNQALLASFMQPYVNTYTQTMVLDRNQVILLYEFTDDLNSSAADFQDLVVLFTFS